MKNSKEHLKRWIFWRKFYGSMFLKTSDINKWGNENFCNSAMRYAREFAAAEEPLIKRISKEEAVLNGCTGNEKVYRII